MSGVVLENSSYGETQGVKLLRHLAGQGLSIFSADEAKQAAAEVGVLPGYLPQLLARLAEAGWVQRLRRGLYAGTGGLPGEVQVHPFAVATHLVAPAAISHWSALHHHGLTEQVPQGVTATTTKKIVTPSMRAGGEALASGKHAWEVGGVRYEYVMVDACRFFGVEEVWVEERFRVPIFDKERSLLDGFVAPQRFGSLSEVLGILEEHLDELNLEKLVDYALRYGKASVAKRVGWALERVGASASILEPLAALPMAGTRKLDPTRAGAGKCNTRWMVQDNLRGGQTE